MRRNACERTVHTRRGLVVHDTELNEAENAVYL